MDLNKLVAVVTIILTLSVASERLVEIIKGFRPQWFTEVPPAEIDTEEGERKEARRKANVAILGIGCGMITSLLASPILLSLFKDIYGDSPCLPLAKFATDLGFLSCAGISLNGLILTLAMGLLASGGSSMWNSILEYLLKVKDLKKLSVEQTKLSLSITKKEFFDESKQDKK